MQVEIKIDDSCIEPRVIIITDKVNNEINDILNTLSSKTPEVITGFYNDLAEILSPEDIIRIYAAGGKTFASASKKEYILRQRLYELEEKLTKHSFVRDQAQLCAYFQLGDHQSEKGTQLRFEFIGYDLRYAIRRYGNICFKTLCIKNQTSFRFIGGKL